MTAVLITLISVVFLLAFLWVYGRTLLGILRKKDPAPLSRSARAFVLALAGIMATVLALTLGVEARPAPTTDEALVRAAEASDEGEVEAALERADSTVAPALPDTIRRVIASAYLIAYVLVGIISLLAAFMAQKETIEKYPEVAAIGMAFLGLGLGVIQGVLGAGS